MEGSVVAVARSVHAQRAVVACRGHARRWPTCMVVRSSHRVWWQAVLAFTVLMFKW
jgi:hypothetical protein